MQAGLTRGVICFMFLLAGLQLKRGEAAAAMRATGEDRVSFRATLHVEIFKDHVFYIVSWRSVTCLLPYGRKVVKQQGHVKGS